MSKRVAPERLAQLYERAQRELQQRGWCQGVLGTSTRGPVCLLGALYLAGGAELSSAGSYLVRPLAEPNRRVIHAAFLQLRRLLRPDGAVSLPDWNDATGRTVEDVLRLLQQARAQVKA